MYIGLIVYFISYVWMHLTDLTWNIFMYIIIIKSLTQVSPSTRTTRAAQAKLRAAVRAAARTPAGSGAAVTSHHSPLLERPLEHIASETDE